MLINLLLIISYLLASSFGLILIKQFFISNDINLMTPIMTIINYKLILGALFYILSFLLWFFLLSKNQLTYIFPIITGLGYVFIIGLSIIFLNENVNYYKILGTLLIFAGVTLIAMKGI